MSNQEELLVSPNEVIKLKEEIEKLTFVVEMYERIGRCSSTDETLEVLLEILVEQVDADRGSIFLFDEENRELYSRAMVGQYHREIRIPIHRGIVGEVFRNNQSEIVEDAYQDDRFDHSIDEESGYRTTNILGVPIVTQQGERIGVAQLLNKKKRIFYTGRLFISG